MARAILRDRVLLGQLLRYGISGVGVTAFNALVYWLLAKPAHINKQLANGIAWALSLMVGYLIHSSWSFKGHGSRADPARIRIRFFATAIVSLGLNAFWVFVFTDALHGPTWSPIPAMAFATPLVIFPLNRRWVFG